MGVRLAGCWHTDPKMVSVSCGIQSFDSLCQCLTCMDVKNNNMGVIHRQVGTVSGRIFVSVFIYSALHVFFIVLVQLSQNPICVLVRCGAS